MSKNAGPEAAVLVMIFGFEQRYSKPLRRGLLLRKDGSGFIIEDGRAKNVVQQFRCDTRPHGTQERFRCALRGLRSKRLVECVEIKGGLYRCYLTDLGRGKAEDLTPQPLAVS